MTQPRSTAHNYGSLPLTFEANHGQTDSRVDFIARTGGTLEHMDNPRTSLEDLFLRIVRESEARPGRRQVAAAPVAASTK